MSSSRRATILGKEIDARSLVGGLELMTKMTTNFLTISFKLNSTYVYPVNVITGLPAYSDTGYSDIPATVTVFGPKRISLY